MTIILPAIGGIVLGLVGLYFVERAMVRRAVRVGLRYKICTILYRP